ncbi:hypothetical protein AALP_AA7G256500 [Arabis alpina]|uniref:Cyanobacterial aminoacyl-tRNA synthetase CAAD domain-containing protein n=1 Tax=Arabis alpina TaxID=50452 RepID=A0A087GKK1_ARAAL|nr:hypothetical protein AALP_AA7G256500 [Arabis alpina]
MELCTKPTITRLPSSIITHHVNLAGNPVQRISLPLHRNISSLNLQSRTLRCTGKFPGETGYEKTSTTEVNEFGLEEKNLNSDEVFEEEQTQALEFLNDIKLDSNNTYSVLLYGSGAIVALYLTSVIVGSLESIPLVPKLMEVVGLGYTFWFTTRYLLFKSNREELKTKISEIKRQVLGYDSE